MTDVMVYPVQLAVLDETVPMSVSVDDQAIDIDFSDTIEIINTDTYDGEYVITPGQQAVILPTTDKVMAQNVVINPIPKNYGLITWNGSTLTVS